MLARTVAGICLLVRAELLIRTLDRRTSDATDSDHHQP
jgi:hypothetical protein